MKAIAKIQRYRLETPEGGWGYLICLGKILIFGLSSSGTAGLIFNDFFKSIGAGTTAFAILTSCTFGSMSLAGLLSNTFIKRFGMRKVGVSGALIYFLGGSVQIFAQRVLHLVIASVVHGVAFGLIIPIIFASFNHYFVKRRILMTGITQCFIGLAHMGYPILVQFIFDRYGFRGCLAILTALHLHTVFAMLVMHPVEWHMKKVPITEEEWRAENNLEDIEEENTEELEQIKPLMSEMKGVVHHKSVDTLRHRKSISSLKHLKLSESAAASRRASSIASLGNWTSAIVVSEPLDPDVKPTGKWKLVVDFLDLTLLKKPTYVNIVLGTTFAFYADISFFSLQPLYLLDLKYTKADVANIIAIGATADLASRCVFSLSSLCCKISPRFVFLGGAILSLFARYAFLYAYDFWTMAIATAVICFLKTWLHVPLGLVFAEYLPKERFSSGYGLFMFLQGNIMFAVGPVMGMVRDKTKSYPITFNFLNLFLIACIVPWIIEIIIQQCRKKKLARIAETINVKIEAV